MSTVPVTTSQIARSIITHPVWGSAPGTATTWDEPQELDTDNEAVITLYDGIKRILRQQREPEARPAREEERKPAPTPKQGKHFLACMKIMDVKVERRLVVIRIMKTNGDIVQLRIQAAED